MLAHGTRTRSPVDPTPVANGNVVLINQEYVVLSKSGIAALDGTIPMFPDAKLQAELELAEGRDRYQLHWASCTDAERGYPRRDPKRHGK